MAKKSRRQIEAELHGHIAEILKLKRRLEELEAEAARLQRIEELGELSRVRAELETFFSTKEESKKILEVEETRARDDDIPAGWERAAAEERERAGLCELNLRPVWRKLVVYDRDKGRPFPAMGRWLLWALRERLDHTNRPAPKPEPEAVAELDEAESGTLALPRIGTEQEQARAAAWARTGLWAPRGQDWGKPPDEAGCTLPAALAAAARVRRTQQNGPTSDAGPLPSDVVVDGFSRRRAAHIGRSGRAGVDGGPSPA